MSKHKASNYETVIKQLGNEERNQIGSKIPEFVNLMDINHYHIGEISYKDVGGAVKDVNFSLQKYCEQGLKLHKKRIGKTNSGKKYVLIHDPSIEIEKANKKKSEYQELKMLAISKGFKNNGKGKPSLEQLKSYLEEINN